MVNRYGRCLAFTHEELGTILVAKLRRAEEIDTKRKRQALFKEIRSLLPDMADFGDWTYELVAVSTGIESNGQLIALAFFEEKHLVEAGQ